MEGDPPSFPSGSTCPMVLGNLSHSMHDGCRLRGCHPLWRAIPDPSAICVHETSLQHEAPKRPHNLLTATRVGLAPSRFGLLPVRSPLLGQSRLISLPRVLRCFTSPCVASVTYGFSAGSPPIRAGGFPHLEISGSTPACDSPELIAACRVLHRRPKPRHPPAALGSLTTRELSAR